MSAQTGQTPAQRRAVIRTALILAAVALAFYLLTLFGGLA
jgi:predicted secreted protein